MQVAARSVWASLLSVKMEDRKRRWVGVRRWEEEPSLSLWVAEWVGKRELQGLEPLLSP